ncbi:MAG: YihY/virulence factor BrkB family protein [Gemmatimonadetes bacterium]|nr:YihY/virulence factor BrkB family protein [Gemmatimonadota bacterium]
MKGPKTMARGVWRIILEAREDNLTGESAKVAYYFFLSIWPLFLGLFAFTGIFGGQPAFEWIMNWVTTLLPEEPTRFLEQYVSELTTESRPDMLSVGILLTFWSGSNIFAALTDGLNTMYDIGEGRTWWKRRAMAIGLLLVASVLLTAGAASILAGHEIIAGLGLASVYNWLRWPMAFLFLTALLWLVYYYLPDRDQGMSLKYVSVGAVVGSSLWVLTTTAFRLYVSNWGSYSRTYGLVGGMIVILIWLYLTALTILFGGEVAVSLEQKIHLEEEGRDPGQT